MVPELNSPLFFGPYSISEVFPVIRVFPVNPGTRNLSLSGPVVSEEMFENVDGGAAERLVYY